MVYAILKFFSKLTLVGYFRKYKIDGKENIPEKGPYIFVTESPQCILDPLVVASSVKTPVYFIAAGEYVGKGLKAWFFKTVLHMIPVYRPSTRPEDTHKNKNMFATCHSHLTQGNSLLIFPEGISITERKLKPLKTGAVRIAIGAEQLNAFKLGVAIVPVGLNYSDPHQWRSDLYVKIGRPIYITDFAPITAENEIEKTKEITGYVQTQLMETILHAPTEDEELMLEKLNRIYANDLKAQFEIKFDESDEEFSMHKDFVNAIAYFKTNKPETYAKAEAKIDAYLADLDHYNLTDKNIGQFTTHYSTRRILSFILGLPLFLTGYLTNVIPYKLVGIIHSKLKLEETFSGSIALALGLFLFLFWYAGITTFIWLTTPLDWFSLAIPVVMYVTGLYALVYLAAIENSVQRKILRSFYRENPEKYHALIKQRQEIIAILSACKADYLATLDA